MTIINPRATIGLQSRFSPNSTNVFGQVQIGTNNQTISYPDSNFIYSFQAFFSNGDDYFDLDSLTLEALPNLSWVAGTAQVETATAAGTATTAGDVTITITASGLNGSPKAIPVAINAGDTASTWAAKVRLALSTDSDIENVFDVSGTSASIILTRKPAKTIEATNSNVNFYDDNDSTLNIAISAGTTGVTSDPTSSSSTEGVATSGVLILDGDGKDIEGNVIGDVSSIEAILFESSGEEFNINCQSYFSGYTSGYFFIDKPSIAISTPINVLSNSSKSSIKVTILGTI